jgi:hypothetical protein
VSAEAETPPAAEPVPTPAPYEHPVKAENRKLAARVLRLERVVAALLVSSYVDVERVSEEDAELCRTFRPGEP